MDKAVRQPAVGSQCQCVNTDSPGCRLRRIDPCAEVSRETAVSLRPRGVLGVARVIRHHRDRTSTVAVRSPFVPAALSGCAAVHRLEHARRGAVDVEVIRSREPDASGESPRREFGDDVARGFCP